MRCLQRGVAAFTAPDADTNDLTSWFLKGAQEAWCTRTAIGTGPRTGSVAQSKRLAESQPKAVRRQPDARLSRHGSVGQWADIRRALARKGCQARLLAARLQRKGLPAAVEPAAVLVVTLEPTRAGDALHGLCRTSHAAGWRCMCRFSQRLPAGLEEGGKGSAGEMSAGVAMGIIGLVFFWLRLRNRCVYLWSDSERWRLPRMILQALADGAHNHFAKKESSQRASPVFFLHAHVSVARFTGAD